MDLLTFGSFIWQGGGSGAVALLPLVFIFVVFYFLLVLPQQRQRKKGQQMVSDLKHGARVVTSGGVRGTIIALRDDYVHLRVPPDNLRIEIARSAVVSVTPPEEAVKTS